MSSQIDDFKKTLRERIGLTHSALQLIEAGKIRYLQKISRWKTDYLEALDRLLTNPTRIPDEYGSGRVRELRERADFDWTDGNSFARFHSEFGEVYEPRIYLG